MHSEVSLRDRICCMVASGDGLVRWVFIWVFFTLFLKDCCLSKLWGLPAFYKRSLKRKVHSGYKRNSWSTEPGWVSRTAAPHAFPRDLCSTGSVILTSGRCCRSSTQAAASLPTLPNTNVSLTHQRPSGLKKIPEDNDPLAWLDPVLNGFNNILPGFKDEDMDKKLYQKSIQSISLWTT